MLDNEPNHLSWCDLCEDFVVICGRCGNNTCNGGSGTEKDGSKCIQCESAYEQWNKGELL